MTEKTPREIAIDILMKIMQENAYNNQALRQTFQQQPNLQPLDKRFITEIVNGSLRHIYYIDYLINHFSNTQTKKMKPFILNLLRSAFYQIYFMNVPPSAICNESVKIVEKKNMTNLKGFVNGVLRTAIRKKDSSPLPDSPSNFYLSILYSHPLWLVDMWVAYYGYEETEKLCQFNNTTPSISIRTNIQQLSTANLHQQLESENITVSNGFIAEDSLHLKSTANLTELSAFQNGSFHVQDESSQLAIKALSPQCGDIILDICSAPGGKSFTMAQEMQNQGQILACDIFPHKLQLIEDGKNRLHLPIIQTEQNDATIYRSDWENRFDKVLADVPCSGLGLLRKKPDIRLKKNGSELDSLIPIQQKILSNVASYLKPNGILLYSTCTLSKKENEKNIEWFLKEYPNFILEDISHILPKEKQPAQQTKYITLFPHITHTDGFFIARMKKTGDLS